MTISDNLLAVRYYTQTDPYYYTVDNRPLQDLDANIQTVAGELDPVKTKLNSKLTELVSVKDYGAVGNGIADDSNAFKNAAAAAGTGYCWVAAGTYNITEAISYPCHFIIAPGVSIPNQHWITSSLTDMADRDYEAMMGMGYFNIWLDGTTFNNPASGTSVATLWKVLYDGTPGTFVVDQAGGPFSVGASNGLRWNQTVAGTGDTYRILEFRVEDASIFNNGKATLSYFVTGDVGTYPLKAEIVQFFGTGGSPSADVVCGNQNITVTTTTKRQVLTVSMPSTSAKTFGNNMDDCVKIRFYVPNNATFNIVFNEVKFERGNIRTPFSQIPLSMQHGYIARYIQYHVISLSFYPTAADQYHYMSIPYKGEMRRIPTASWTGLSGESHTNLHGSLNNFPATTYMQKYGGTAYIRSAAAGNCHAIGQLLKLDARL